MSDKKNVCGNGFNGVHGTTVTLENHSSSTVTVNSCPDGSFPFSSPAAPFSITAGSSVDATLQNTLGTYDYCTSGCPNLKDDTNPKTVIIS